MPAKPNTTPTEASGWSRCFLNLGHCFRRLLILPRWARIIVSHDTEQNTNLRTQLTRMLTRAGIKPWPKLFHNLRSTRETELFKLTNGNVKAVCSWIGNSPTVAIQHYAQVTEADIQEAAKMSLINDAEKAVHPTVVNHGKPMQSKKKSSGITPCRYNSKQRFTAVCNSVQKDQEWALQDSNL